MTKGESQKDDDKSALTQAHNEPVPDKSGYR